MTTLDRKTPPSYGAVGRPIIPPYSTDTLGNGVPIHVMRGGSQPIVKIDLIFQAGKLRSPKALLARLTANMLLEGTTSKTSREIAERLEYFGAYAWGTVTWQHSVASLLCLQKDVSQCVRLMEDYVKNPTFPEEELRLALRQDYQNYKVGLMKTSRVALRNSLQMVYEKGCPYGRFATDKTFEEMSVEDLRAFHDEAYTQTGARIFISGQPSETDVSMIADKFGANWRSGNEWSLPTPKLKDHFGESITDMKSEQTSVVMVNKVMGKDHPEFMPFRIVDTVLGGYFSSRLMQNLRERLGLTYGVGSWLTSFPDFSLHYIRTDVKKGEHERVVDEIRKEIRNLCEAPISKEEMEMVRNFMLGDLSRMFDTTLTAADTVMGLLSAGTDEKRSQVFYDTLTSATPEMLLEVARKWLDADAYGVSVAGVLK